MTMEVGDIWQYRTYNFSLKVYRIDCNRTDPVVYGTPYNLSGTEPLAGYEGQTDMGPYLITGFTECLYKAGPRCGITKLYNKYDKLCG